LPADKPISHWWAGCAAGFAQSIIISPVELIKTQMQIQGIGQSDMKNYRGWRATCGHIFNHSGITQCTLISKLLYNTILFLQNFRTASSSAFAKI